MLVWLTKIASASKTTATSRNSGSVEKEKPLDDLLQRLGIEDDEFDDLIFEDESKVPLGMKWMALARVHTKKNQSANF